jgi:hypothetical protein
MATLRTYNRKLEQTLFHLGVTFLSCDKDDEGMTYWTYPNNEKVKQIFDWFKEANTKRRKAGW